MESPSRLVPLEGSFNFRDLGGYPGLDGRHTRWGQLFRADALHELTADDLVQLRDLGLRTVIDLRTERELDRSGRGLLEPEPIGFHHLAVVQEGVQEVVTVDTESLGAPAPPGDDLAERYLWYLDVGRRSLVEALGLLSRAEHYPLVFHCAAGKDRTGVLAALTLDILGVDRQEIVADYMITAERLGFILDRWRASDPMFAERMASVPTSRFSVEASTMEGFLDGLSEYHGGARAWAVGAGVPEKSLDRMVDLLLESGD